LSDHPPVRPSLIIMKFYTWALALRGIGINSDGLRSMELDHIFIGNDISIDIKYSY